MRVLVDATMLDGAPSGAATRLAALGAAHARRGAVQVRHLVRPGLDPLSGLDCVPLSGGTRPWTRALAGRRLTAALARHDAALLHCGALPLPRVTARPLLLTLHDLRFLLPGARVSAFRRGWGRHRLARNLARAVRVVCVSEHTATDLVSRGLCGAERVAVVPNAGTPGLSPPADPDGPDDLARFRRRADLNRRYVLAVGPNEPHKKLGLLLSALAVAKDLRGGEDLGLALAGRTTPRRALALARRADELGLADRVRVLGPLTDEQLSLALSGADALAVTAVHEGFSIPVVDAQRFGVPVVAVAAGALPDTAGEDGAWFSPPDDPRSLARALLEAVTPGAERDRRLAAARSAAERWSWDASAAALEALWREVAGAR